MAINSLLGTLFDYELHRKSALNDRFEELIDKGSWRFDLQFYAEISKNCSSDVLDLMEKSKAQLRQDIFAIIELDFMSGGFFVDFGAYDGITLSNSYMLEKHFGFKGILSEPNPKFAKMIPKYRKAVVEEKCVWSASGEILEFVDAGKISTIKDFADSDMHAHLRQSRLSFEVETITLTDMLQKHGAPAKIDYLSIDTEGSEFEILNSHDFSKFSFKVITVEHAFTSQREKIYNLLTKHGYARKFEELSMFDDWYVLT